MDVSNVKPFIHSWNEPYLIFFFFIFLFLKNYLFIWLCGVLAEVGSRARRLNSCGVQAQFPVACGILVAQPGIEPTSPALKGRVLTTEMLGSPPFFSFEKAF